MKTISFSQKISIINSNPYVRPPDEVLSHIFIQSGKTTSPIPVKGKIDGADFTQTLVRYKGDWRLYINIVMAKKAHIPFSKSISEIVGKEITIEIAFNPTPISYTIDPLLQDALDKNAVARKQWDALIPSRKKEIIRYFAALKSLEAKEKNLEKILHVLNGNKAQFMGRSWQNGK